MTDLSTGALREHGPADEPLIVAPTALAARQWELHLAGHAARELRRGAWLTPAVSYRSFAADLWSLGHPERPPPLTPGQSGALWRRIVAESAEAPQLLGYGGPAEWAAAAWALLLRYGLEPQTLRARAGEHDFAAFLRWARRYAELLRGEGWIDQPLVDAALAAAPLEPPLAVTFAGFGDWPPVQAALAERLEAGGVRVAQRGLPAVQADLRRARFADGNTEIAAAATWAAALLAARPATRVALVLPDAAAQAATLERALARAAALNGGDFPVWRAASPAPSEPLLEAALTAIELVAEEASFATFSRWLRNPFFASADEHRDARALLEARLRRTLHTRLPFREAYRRAGLAPLVRAASPATAAALDAALAAAERLRRGPPSRWLELWQRVLTSLGLVLTDDDASRRAVREWQAVLDTFAQLTPVVGELDAASARAELERIVADRGSAQPLPVRGVHVLERLDELGPGYDAVWAAGFTSQQWPPPLRGNPLLPRAVQARAGMPGGSPQAARLAAERSFAAFARAAPVVVVSWPARVFDYEAEPSPALRAIPDLDEAERRTLERGITTGGPRRPLVTVHDDAAPPLPGPDLPGGSAALRRQAEAPLVAFCEFRLHARPLEPVDVGLSAPMRGKIVHRAAELFAGAQPAGAGLEAALEAVRPAVETALDETFGAARTSLRSLYELERERLAALLEQLAVSERERAPYVVERLEQRREIAVGRWRVKVRLDRVDRLASGGLAIIDYKTGSRRAAWWNGPLRDVQVPLYVAHAGEPVAAAVIVRLADGAARYDGYWSDGAFPGGPRKLPDGRSFDEQIGIWRAALAALADELGAGDTRLYDDELDDARTRYAVLTRVLAVLAAERRGERAP